jgi:hypothetical protein
MVQHAGWDSLATNAIDAGVWVDPPLKPCPPIPVHWGVPQENPECADLWRQQYGARPAISQELSKRLKPIYTQLLHTRFGPVFSRLVKVSKAVLELFGYNSG